MAETTNYTCDVCGAPKGEANHWWRARVLRSITPFGTAIGPGIRAEISSFSGFAVWAWDVKCDISNNGESGKELYISNGASGKELHLCGQECVIKKLAESLR